MPSALLSVLWPYGVQSTFGAVGSTAASRKTAPVPFRGVLAAGKQWLLLQRLLALPSIRLKVGLSVVTTRKAGFMIRLAGGTVA